MGGSGPLLQWAAVRVDSDGRRAEPFSHVRVLAASPTDSMVHGEGGKTNALGARDKARKARKAGAKSGRGKGRTGALRSRSTGSADSDDDPLARSLDFQPRYSPMPAPNTLGFIGYLLFLFLFLAVTVMRRNSDVYNFSEMTKRLVTTDHFVDIRADTDYFQWLSLHFLPGLAGASHMVARDSNFKMVGAPRIRQVRAAPCEPGAGLDSDEDGWGDATTDDETAGDTHHPRKIVPACWRNDEETGSTESFGGPDGNLFTYQDATELSEQPYYNSEGGLWLPGGGFVIPAGMLKRLMVGAGRPEEAATATVEVPVTEFHAFSYTGYNVSALQDNGWWDARTTAIFHDFTVASSNGMYSHCRLILTVGNNHGLVHPSVEMHVTWLERFETLEIVFYMYVIVLAVGKTAEFHELYKSPNQLVQESITEQRYWLYQRFQQYAAFHGIAKYDPHPYMERLMRRLHGTYQDDPPKGTEPPTPGHIERMNKIGLAMVKCHDDWKVMVEMGARKVDFKLNEVDNDGQLIVDDAGQRRAAIATLSLFDRVQKLHDNRLKIKKMQRLDKLGLCSPQQFLLRFPIAARLFIFQPWNLLDAINYALFMWSLWIRIHSLQLVPQVASQIGDLNADTMHMKYINFSELAHSDRLQYNINAFNAILTWIKIFRFLDFYPPMLTLTNTLYRASKLLSSLIVTVAIILLGSGQGFFMVFGLEVHMYRDFGASVMGLLRMAVGDFDYTELAQSNRTLGPLMFWLYIILVLFVVMSMFVALVSEVFKEAKEAQQNRSYRVGAYGYRRLRTKKLLEEAGDRWRFSSPENTGIMSKAMHRQLAEFSDRPPEDPSKNQTALMLFLQQQKESDHTAERTAIIPDDVVDNKLRGRRGSVSQLDLPRTLALLTPVDLVNTALSGFENTWMGKKLRGRMYWSTGCDVIKTTAGQKHEVPGWFKNSEARREGVEYITTKHYDARDPRELSFAKGAIIVVTEKPPGGFAHPITGNRTEGVWKGYLKYKGPASVKIVYGFDEADEEGRYSLGGFLKEVDRLADTRLADAVDLSDGEEDTDNDTSEAEHAADLHIIDGNSNVEETGPAPHSVPIDPAKTLPRDLDFPPSAPHPVPSKPAKTRRRDFDLPLSMAQPDPAYYATGNSIARKSFGETMQHEQSRKEKEFEKRLQDKDRQLVEQDKELRKLRKENEALKVQSLNRRESQLSHSSGAASAGLEARVDAIAEALHGTIPAAIAAATEQLRSELDEIKGVLVGGADIKQLSGGGAEHDTTRSGGFSTDRSLANREDGRWVKMANLQGGAMYEDAQEYWHHTGTNAIRKSPPAGIQAYDDAGKPIEIDGATVRWDDDSTDSSVTSDLYPPGQVFDPVAQSRVREKQRKQAQARERARKAGEIGHAYGMRNTPASMALESGGISRTTSLHLTASKIAGGTMR